MSRVWVPGVAFAGEGDAILATFDFCAGVGLGAFAVAEAFGEGLGAGVGAGVGFEPEVAAAVDPLLSFEFEFEAPDAADGF